MEKNISLSKQNTGFPKAFNPHLRRNKNIKKNQEEEKKIIQESELLEQKEKNIPILISKEYLARQLRKIQKKKKRNKKTKKIWKKI